MAGVLPTRSVRALRYMQQDVAGVTIPDEYIRRMEQAADPAEEGVKMAVELIQQLKEIEGVAGVHFNAGHVGEHRPQARGGGRTLSPAGGG